MCEKQKTIIIPSSLVHYHVRKPQNLQSWADTGRQHASPLVKENFYQYQEHLKFVCILFSSTLNNFRSQITGVSDQSASWLVLETQECYTTLWYSTSIFQFNNHLTCTHTPRDERRKGIYSEREREIQGRWRGFGKYIKKGIDWRNHCRLHLCGDVIWNELNRSLHC